MKKGRLGDLLLYLAGICICVTIIKSNQMEMSGRVSLFIRFIAHIFVLVIIFHKTSYANNVLNCSPSSCGDLDSIRHPFRLTADPPGCGDRRYELSCEDNLTFLHLRMPYTHEKKFYKAYVQAINYDNWTIRVVEPDLQKDDCSFIPKISLTKDDILLENGFDTKIKYNHARHGCWPSLKFRRDYNLTETVIFLTCEKPMNGSHLYHFMERAPCVNNNTVFSESERLYSYVVINGNLSFSDLEESCRVDTMTLISRRKGRENLINTSTYRDVYNELVYGFELSWLPSFEMESTEYKFFRTCFRESCEYKYLKTCYIDEDHFNNNKVQCLIHCGYPVKFHAFLDMLLAQRMTGTILVIAFLIYKWRRRHLSVYDGIEEFLQSYGDLMPVRFSSWDIRKMSTGFKDKLGEGGFGSVYKGKLSNGRLVAIKVLGESKANGQDFINEVSTIGRIHHVNIVQLIGFCVEGSNRALIYDFMPNGSLDKHIFPKLDGVTISFSSKEIFEISLGIARGVEYLHRGCDKQILHFDIKPHNILLDENFIPKISDFGLARLCPLENSIVSLTVARGTIGYIAPELIYKNVGGVSYKADVYSFGMVLMEMATKRNNLNADVENSSQVFFPSWIYDQYRQGKGIEVEDATEEESKTVKKMIIVALWCIQLKPGDRPSMSKVIEMLEGEVESLQMPPNPHLYPQEQEHEKHEFEAAWETSILSEEDSQESSWISNVR